MSDFISRDQVLQLFVDYKTSDAKALAALYQVSQAVVQLPAYTPAAPPSAPAAPGERRELAKQIYLQMITVCVRDPVTRQEISNEDLTERAIFCADKMFAELAK